MPWGGGPDSPATFPQQESDIPTAGDSQKYPGDGQNVYYKEGLDVGYRWYDARNITPAFPFGFGLSYTSFGYSNLSETAARDLAGLLAEGRDLQLGVNVSVRHLQAGCLAPDVASALAGAGVPPRRLMIEITESVMLDAEARVASDLATLREMGCIISLDDFGRGWSSLAYLARLPVDVLKMDREFVAGIEGDRRGAALVASVIELGRTLGMDVVAEGVETPGQLRALRDMGCRFVQGYLLGRPVPLAQLRGALAAFDPAVLGDDASDMDTTVHLVGRQG